MYKTWTKLKAFGNIPFVVFDFQQHHCKYKKKKALNYHIIAISWTRHRQKGWRKDCLKVTPSVAGVRLSLG